MMVNSDRSQGDVRECGAAAVQLIWAEIEFIRGARAKIWVLVRTPTTVPLAIAMQCLSLSFLWYAVENCGWVCWLARDKVGDMERRAAIIARASKWMTKRETLRICSD
jgi:hypothetical protein